jgi:hypothetical protein
MNPKPWQRDFRDSHNDETNLLGMKASDRIWRHVRLLTRTTATYDTVVVKGEFKKLVEKQAENVIFRLMYNQYAPTQAPEENPPQASEESEDYEDGQSDDESSRTSVSQECRE